MFNRLKQLLILFNPFRIFTKNRLKKYSTTMTSANEGVDSKKELNADIKEIIKRVQSSNKITHEEVNTLLTFYFNKKEINPGIYTFNKNIVNGMVFEITGVNTVLNNDNDVENIYIALRDIVYNIEFITTISAKEFYEVFKDFNQRQPPAKRNVENVN